MPRSVARLLAETLEAHDIDLVYCVPGESYLGLTDAFADMNSIRLIVCRHEGGAAFMAVADGRMRDRAGVCVVSRGPGLSNAMLALHTAYHDATRWYCWWARWNARISAGWPCRSRTIRGCSATSPSW